MLCLSHSLLIMSAALLIAAGGNDIDWNRARRLFQQRRSGEQLSVEDQAYLDRAIEDRNRKEAKKHTRGDDSSLGAARHAFRIDIPESISPVKSLEYKSKDGTRFKLFYRKPPGKGPFPVIVFFHGGGNRSGDKDLKNNTLNGSIQTRFLKLGYIVVTSTRRVILSWKESDVDGAVEDCVAAIEEVKEIDGVDAESVVVYGGSGGGSMGISTAAETELAVLVVGEPASFLFTGMLTKVKDVGPILQDPEKYYTPEIKRKTIGVLEKIECPILILHGDVHKLFKLNKGIIIPELKRLDKIYDLFSYKGYAHGFYWGRGPRDSGKKITVEFIEKLVADVDRYIKKHIKTQPKPINTKPTEDLPNTGAPKRGKPSVEPSAESGDPRRSRG